ncbi:hypothetical protein N7476_009119 [Penicillium atrosanguineum]|uniref:Uncharacterized protein n=1 Tax=Penicillium atrosanguineum TaxID=1132637 RepID=A0A9W9U281_9EURO|nr:hypothetical protein N7526_002130 [Penicillium atrosanguineum]KAJ5308463.1 hypothetical protein N7476_009119 [Penicillium atrosanguineum]
MLYPLAIISGDINSFDKEYDGFVSTNRPGPLDSVLFYLLVSQGVTVGDAKDLLREKFRENQLKYYRLKHEYLLEKRPGKKIKTWLHHLELCIAGVCVWAARGYRYHADLKRPEYRPRDMDTLADLLSKDRPISSQFWGRRCQQDGVANIRESSVMFGGPTELNSADRPSDKADHHVCLIAGDEIPQPFLSEATREAPRSLQHSKALPESVS